MMSKYYAIKILKSFYNLKNKKANKEAVVDDCGKRRTTFDDYIKTVNSIAKYLRDNNVKPGELV